MQLPSFSYSVSRVYPYPWFTWVVIIGGICATIFFSALNLAANGYNLVVQYTTDPNATISQQRWTERFPFSMVERTVASCQSQNLPINSQFFTDKLSLEYTLVGVWQEQGNDIVTLPSLRYINNTLENCYVNIIQVDLKSTQRTSEQQAWTSWGPEATALITCSISNDVVPTWFNLTASYELVTPTTASLNNGTAAFSFLNLNSQTKASLWWAQSLLSWYWLNLVTAMNEWGSWTTENEGNYTIAIGNVGFFPSNISDIGNLDFFTPEYDFITQQVFDDGTLGAPECCMNPGSAKLGSTLSEYVKNEAYPYIWVQADTFAKSFYSTVLADLGQNSTETFVSNGNLLQQNTNFRNMGNYTDVETTWLKAGPARKSYNDLKDSTGSLSIKPSTIYAQYFCQIPELKSGGSLFIAVLVADLVFLQALWKILTWSTTMWLEHSNEKANYCEGCLRSMGHTHELSKRGATSQYLPVRESRPSLIKRKPVAYSSESIQPLVMSPKSDNTC